VKIWNYTRALSVVKGLNNWSIESMWHTLATLIDLSNAKEKSTGNWYLSNPSPPPVMKPKWNCIPCAAVPIFILMKQSQNNITCLTWELKKLEAMNCCKGGPSYKSLTFMYLIFWVWPHLAVSETVSTDQTN
jgi:hypothetical protein